MMEFMPKAILFDLDDAILDFDSGAEPCWREACERFAGELEGISAEQLRAAVGDSRQRFWSDPKRNRRGRLKMLDARWEIVAEALASLRVEAPELAARIADAYAGEPHDAVVTQNFQGACHAVSYLIDRGHRHIGLVAGPSDAFPSLRERRRAYLHALRDRGVEDSYVANCPMRSAGKEAVAATAQLLRQHPQVTALFGCNDLLAIRAMQAAGALSRRIPDDLSVVGFDDIEAAHLVMPALTTMRVDKPGTGRMAVQMLLQRLQHPELPPVVSALATRLVERQSVRDIHPGSG